MKLYCVGATPEELAKLRAFCQENQWPMSVTDSLGRPRVNLPVQKVVNAFRREKGVRATARATGINPGHVYRVLKSAGEL